MNSSVWNNVPVWDGIWREAGPAQYTKDDPLDVAGAWAEVQRLQTDWYADSYAGGSPILTDRNMLAVTQALRAAILSSQTDLMLNAQMFQAIRDLPIQGTPLEVYQEHLGPVRENWQSYKFLPTLDSGIELATRVALTDVALGGAGKTWREGMMSRKTKVPKTVGILGLSDKTFSFAWLILMPTTSQIAAIDRHMTMILKLNFPADPQVQAVSDSGPKTSNEYYFLENKLIELRAMKGYQSLPLAAFQWAEWDFYRSGPGYNPDLPKYYENEGWHQDHTPFRVEDPVPVEEAEWGPHERKRVAPKNWVQPTDYVRHMPAPGTTRTPPAYAASQWDDSWDPWD